MTYSEFIDLCLASTANLDNAALLELLHYTKAVFDVIDPAGKKVFGKLLAETEKVGKDRGLAIDYENVFYLRIMLSALCIGLIQSGVRTNKPDPDDTIPRGDRPAIIAVTDLNDVNFNSRYTQPPTSN